MDKLKQYICDHYNSIAYLPFISLIFPSENAGFNNFL
jgi:hypothetical protein